ncbi:hypothetical protein K2173_027992 [Erythroxylum novogranatense]|uniref:RING-type E3 ubiquitin transferase n=1 Tax=Erythroxylum novogranatense TaxID=1862640 RepID=A0AAV8U493_9ROSI|nr:hypothetical protein K2173_027992 [Erythroxylum novogranatense]
MALDDSSTEFRLQVDVVGYESLLERLAESDGARRGALPASKRAVVTLPKVKIALESNLVVCAVCKDMVNVGETETKLPRGHGYPGHCIMPWLGSRNSCPVYRFKLPTDDAEYEEERKKRVGASSSGGDGSGSY